MLKRNKKRIEEMNFIERKVNSIMFKISCSKQEWILVSTIIVIGTLLHYVLIQHSPSPSYIIIENCTNCCC